MKRYKWELLAAGLALSVVAGYFFYSGDLDFGRRAPRERAIHALYVWQRLWTDEVRETLSRSTESVRHFMVLTHEDGMPPIAVDWKALAGTRLAVTLVYRYPEALGRELAADLEGAVARVAGEINEGCNAAMAEGVRLRGVQIDYDAPTRSLGEYDSFLRKLKESISEDQALSVTALPTWLDDDAFATLVSRLDYYVLQVHSFEPPGSSGAPMILCDTEKIPGYVSRAEGIGTPYFIAFPTHGYEVAFDSGGKFIGLSAEGPDPAWPDGAQLREVRADPAAIAGAVNALATDIPSHFRGAVWFRMPVASDTRNWTWPVLAAVMEGRVPSVRFATEIRNPDPGLAEIWLSSIGEDRPNRTVEIQVSLSEGDVLASDCVNGFTANTGGDAVILRGPAPVDKAPILVGWYRMKDEGAALGLRVLDTVNAERSTERKGAG